MMAQSEMGAMTACAFNISSDLPVTELIGIFSTGRNGSTLLARLLDGIPGTFVHPVEANFLCAMNDLAVRDFVSENVIKNVVTHPLRHLDQPIPTERLQRYFVYHQKEIETDLLPVVDGIELGPQPFDALESHEAWGVKAYVTAFLGAFVRWLQPGAKPDRVIFKSIETPYVPAYERLFPTMRFIHLVRDPVETWASQKRSLVIGKNRPPWYLRMDNLSACIDRRWIPHARIIAERRESPSHFLVRYEDLTRDANAVMARLCDWMGLRERIPPTVQTVLGGHHPRKMMRYSSQPGVETSREVVADLKDRYDYVDVVTDRERDLIRLATWTLGRALGYGLDVERPDPIVVRRLWKSIDDEEFAYGGGVHISARNMLSYLKRRLYVRHVCREAMR
jgi:hypothetical protein